MQVDVVYVIASFISAGGVIAFLYRQLITSKDALLESERKNFALILAQKDADSKEQDSIKKSYQEIAQEAQQTAINTANFYREKDGKPPLIIAAAVVPESHSPPTAMQRETALIASMRAVIANIRLATGQDPRKEHGPDED